MNHLAHLVLAGPNPDHRLGALLGDHVKGRLALQTLPAGLRSGVVLHRRIDAWTDAHPVVLDLARGLDPPWRRYSGVILDVLFDAMLVRNWCRYHARPLAQFAKEIDDLLMARRAELPARLIRFALWARAVDLWTRYDERAMLDEIFSRLARRHGRLEPLASGTRLLEQRETEIEQTFNEVFPDLQARARSFLQQC